jgi:hypothetical protein
MEAEMIETSTLITILIWVALAAMFAVAAWADSEKVRGSIVGVR